MYPYQFIPNSTQKQPLGQPQYMPMMMVPMYPQVQGQFEQQNPFGASQFNIDMLSGDKRIAGGVKGSDFLGTRTSSSNIYKQPKTKAELLDNFKKELLPELGYDRLVKLQAVSSVFTTRRSGAGMSER